jgi:hypothetical protein
METLLHSFESSLVPANIDRNHGMGLHVRLLISSCMEVKAVKVLRLICKPRVAGMTFEPVNGLGSWRCWTMVMLWLAIGFKIWGAPSKWQW